MISISNTNNTNEKSTSIIGNETRTATIQQQQQHLHLHFKMTQFEQMCCSFLFCSLHSCELKFQINALEIDMFSRYSVTYMLIFFFFFFQKWNIACSIIAKEASSKMFIVNLFTFNWLWLCLKSICDDEYTLISMLLMMITCFGMQKLTFSSAI